jgi:hypothetical protein
MAPQIDNPHDWAIWLLRNLEAQQVLAIGHIEGKLPLAWGFSQTVAAIGDNGYLIGMTDETSRTIEFHPQRVGVYESLNEMFAYPNNLKSVPQRFTVRDLCFTYDAHVAQPGSTPPQVQNYFSAVKLCSLLPSIADMAANNGTLLHFIKSPESRIEIKLAYQAEDLNPLPSLSYFETVFVVTDSHRDQKYSILRAVLLDAFKGKKSIRIGEVIQQFESLIEAARSNYSMYAAEFSFEKVKAEIEKDNLDSTLKLNKTLSEIQNQLLAMPVALVLVGGQMTPDTGLSIKNVVIWLGACVFAGLMILLIRNQRHAVCAIKEEVRLRKIKVDAQPDGMAGKFKSGFDALQQRVLTQTRTLNTLRSFVFLSILLATGLLVWYSNPDFHKVHLAEALGQSTKGAAGTVQQQSGTASGSSPAPAPVSTSTAAQSKPVVKLAEQDMNTVQTTPASSAAPAQQNK